MDPAVRPDEHGLEVFERRADELLAALRGGDDGAAWRLKWQHPRFRGRHVAEVRAAARAAALGPDDARLVVAREQACADWTGLAALLAEVRRPGRARRFEAAADAVVAGDVAGLRALLAEDPALARARSPRAHGATLLHYVAANGVEAWRQRTPADAPAVARLLLDAGAEPDATADLYDEPCTTLSLLVSSSPPAEAGLQGALAELLLDRGAALEGVGSRWGTPLRTALAFGFLDTARRLAARGAAVDLVAAAGLGRREDAARLLPAADAAARHAALALAAQHGHADVVALLLDAGEAPDRFNPEGFHAHATPLHHAALHGHAEVVRLLVARGAPLDVRDAIHDATPAGWAEHAGRADVMALLHAAGGAGT
jgi:ankyrin repeat protein